MEILNLINHINYIYLVILVIIMIGDIITGLVKCACGASEKSNNGNFESGIMKECGLKKICCIFFIVGVDIILSYFNLTGIVTACYIYYFVVEGFSILENLNACGVSVPPVFKKFLETKKTEIEEGETDESN